MGQFLERLVRHLERMMIKLSPIARVGNIHDETPESLVIWFKTVFYKLYLLANDSNTFNW